MASPARQSPWFDKGRQFLTGSRGLGVYELRLGLQVASSPPGALAGPLSVHASVFARQSAGMSYLGQADLYESVHVADSPRPVNLICALHQEQLEEFEMWRQGRAFELMVNLTGLFFCQDQPPMPIQSQESYSVSAHDWADALERMGFCESLIVIVPAPQQDRSPERHEAFRRFRIARRALLEGRDPDVAREVRTIVEQLWRTDDGKSRLNGQPKQNRNKQERLIALADALFDLLSMAAHGDEQARTATWTRADSTLALGLVALLMRATFDA